MMHKYKILYDCKQDWSHSVIIKINIVLKNMREIDILHIGDYVSTQRNSSYTHHNKNICS